MYQNVATNWQGHKIQQNKFYSIGPRPSSREYEAIQEFHDSNTSIFHLMRDHKAHTVPILSKQVAEFILVPQGKLQSVILMEVVI